MSDSARDLLIHGKAAAQGNSPEEARFYLEWVLRSDADIDQETDAWYWLSRVSDDPAEKRDCLENVLAAYPHHPEARRDLAVLEGRLNQQDVVDLRRPVAPVSPSAEVGKEEMRRYVCPKCGGKMTFQPEKQSLFCQFCGYRKSDGEDQPGSVAEAVAEQDWVAAIYTERGHRWELPTTRTLNCRGCGAHVTIQPSHVSTTCLFCGSPHVAEAEESRELIQPGGVLTFAFGAAVARQHALGYLRESRFRPDDLDDSAAVATPRPVYLPFWTFDISGEVTWRGYVYESEYGRSRQVPTEGILSVHYDDLLVPGSKSLPEEHLSALRYDTRNPTPYSTDLLADWPAEIYSVAMSDAAVAAHGRAYRESGLRARQDMAHSVGADVQDVRIAAVNLSVMSYKLVLLPVWVTEYLYKGERYPLLVNGRSGQAHGSVPRSGLQQLLGGIFGG